MALVTDNATFMPELHGHWQWLTDPWFLLQILPGYQGQAAVTVSNETSKIDDSLMRLLQGRLYDQST